MEDSRAEQARTLVRRIEERAGTAEQHLGRSATFSAVLAVAAWGVLFGVRVGEGAQWTVPGLVVLLALLAPAAALFALRGKLRAVRNLPAELTSQARDAASTLRGDELRERLADLEGKSGLRLILAVASALRWLTAATEVSSVTGTVGRVYRAALTAPFTAGVGVVGTVAVALLLPVFALASLLLFLVG